MKYWAILAVAVSLTACSKSGAPDRVAKSNVASDAAVSASAAKQASPTVVAPQIAYTYSYSFRLDPDNVTGVQQKQIALCDQLGLARCHVVSMSQQGGSHGSEFASLTLEVDARIARRFGDALVNVAAQAGGATVDRQITGEDLSKQIVDVQARLRAKQALADRLLAIVQTHKGSIADLVSAEKSLTDVQQDIDTARAELAEAQGRVETSTFNLTYNASRPGGGFFDPLSAAWHGLGTTLGESLATLITIVGALLPWAVILGLVLSIHLWWRRRHRPLDADVE